MLSNPCGKCTHIFYAQPAFGMMLKEGLLLNVILKQPIHCWLSNKIKIQSIVSAVL